VQSDLRHGLIAGLLGGLSIIIFFLASDAISLQPLATPDSLSENLPGLSEIATGVAGDIGGRVAFVGRIGIFTLLHLCVFAVLGTLLATLRQMSGARKSLLFGGLYGLTVCTVVFFGGLSLSGDLFSAAPEWPLVLLANFVSGVVMGGYLAVSESL